MAFPASPTVGQIRDKVMIRLGMNRSGNARKHLMDAALEWIVSAHKELFLRHPWARTMATLSIDTVAGQRAYEFPDEMMPGLITSIHILDTGGNYYKLQRDPHPRNWENASLNSNDMPRIWFIENQSLNILPPAPEGDSYPEMLITYRGRQGQVSVIEDRIEIDEELLIRWATAEGFRYFGQMDKADRAEGKAREYEEQARGQDREGRRFSVGRDQFQRIERDTSQARWLRRTHPTYWRLP